MDTMKVTLNIVGTFYCNRIIIGAYSVIVASDTIVITGTTSTTISSTGEPEEE